MNNFVEDEVNALVGVPSNVPPTTLVGCLFELLRSSGSQMFLRRLWSQFRTTLPVDSPYACVSWSKTETLVVIVQTLYPRVLRRVKSWLGDKPFSLSVQSSFFGVRCTVRCCPDDSLREVCVVDEDVGFASCESEIRCLTCVLSLVSTRRWPIAIQNCPPVLFNAYMDWCRSMGRPVPVVATIFDFDLLRRLVRDASFVCVGSVDPFAVIEYLAQRLKKFSSQAWLLNLPQFRLCLGSGVVPPESLSDVLHELLDHWSDIKICLSNDVLLMRKNIKVVDLDSLLCSDRLSLPRLALLHVFLLCFRSNCKRLFESGVADYSCRSFTDFCFFFWSLLSKVSKVSQLPFVDNWSDYIDKLLNNWANVAVSECLQGEPSIMKALRGLDDGLRRSFLRECQGYLLEFLKVLGSCSYAKSRVARSLCCLSVDMLMGGDADYAVDLFQDLVLCLQESGCLGDVERDAATNEFESLIVDLRQRCVDCSQISDVFTYLEGNESYQCRAYVKQVVRLVRVIVCPVLKPLPPVDISTSGTSLPPSVIRSGLQGVQSFVLQPKFVSSDLLTVECLEALKVNLPNGPQFLGCGSFNPWAGVSRHSSEEIYNSLFECYVGYYSGQVNEWRARMSSNVAVCSSSSAGGAPVDGSQSVSCLSSQTGKGSKHAARQGKSC